jgi:hypothetical protein
LVWSWVVLWNDLFSGLFGWSLFLKLGLINVRNDSEGSNFVAFVEVDDLNTDGVTTSDMDLG